MRILLLSDIHGNFPAVEAIIEAHPPQQFDAVINCGDSLVYGPFPNDTLHWLESIKSISILGNTDKKVITLCKGGDFKKPSNPEKRIMYTWTAESLNKPQKKYLFSLPKKSTFPYPHMKNMSQESPTIGIFHGSPAKNHEFLFNSTPDTRFKELAHHYPKYDIVVCGHSHSPFHKCIGGTHFINPGSVGRMFDGNPRASFATLTIAHRCIKVTHHRIEYAIHDTIEALKQWKLPEIYCRMYSTGKKLN